MKINVLTIVVTAATLAIGNAAISISGSALRNVQGSTATDLAAGRLALLVLDTTGASSATSNGFLTGLTGGTSPVTATNPFSSSTRFETTGANLGIGSYFGGDLVIARFTTSLSATGTDTVIPGALTNYDFSPYLGKQYAIVWFESLTTAGNETVGSGNFGIARGADWIFPGADGAVNQTFGTGTTNLDSVLLANGGSSSAATAGTGQSVAFATAGTTLSFVPEPSAALLGVIGSLSLLRRRRN
jgi:hypothetical protein